MKLAENVVEIDQSEDLQSAGFGFEFNAKMADMLSNKIYSDPILAVVREYICNAVDAHNTLTINRAIDIGIPSFIDPTWFVRDYGPGLSQEQIMGVAPNYRGLFNTYGRSDKSNSNSSIGGFGLGSKAGFAYVKQDGAFTVTSWHGGRKKVYTCHRNTKGLPAVTLMSDTASEEHTGIKIAIPVQADDYKKFFERTESVIRYMDQEFTLSGTTNVPKGKPEYILKGDRWGIRNDYGETAIIMGGIAYPVDRRQFNGDTQAILGYRFDIIAPIGSVELSVSREALSYEGSTIPYIIAECNRIKGEVAAELVKSIEQASTLIEASRQYRTITNQNLGWFVRNTAQKDFKWRGKKLLYQIAKYKYDYTTGNNVFHSYTVSSNIRLENDKSTTLRFYFLRLNSYTEYASVSFRDRGWSNGLAVNINDQITFIYDDCGDRYKQRISGMVKKFKEANDTVGETVVVVKGCTWRQFLGLYIKAGRHHKYSKLSELEEYAVPRVPSNYKPPKDSKRDINYLGHNNTYSNSGMFKQINVDFADTSEDRYYLPTKHYRFYSEFSDATRISKCHDMDDFNFKLALGLTINPRIYLVPFTYKNLVLTNKKWINAAERLREILVAAANDQAFVNSKKLNDDLHSNWRHTDKTYVKFVTDIHKLYTQCPILKGTFWEELSKKAEKIVEISDPKFSQRFVVVENILKFFGESWDDVKKVQPNVASLDTIERGDINKHLPIMEFMDLEAAINSGNKSVLDSLAALVVQRDQELKSNLKHKKGDDN